MTLEVQQLLERYQCLNRSFEAGGARFESVLAGGLGDDRTGSRVKFSAFFDRRPRLRLSLLPPKS